MVLNSFVTLDRAGFWWAKSLYVFQLFSKLLQWRNNQWTPPRFINEHTNKRTHKQNSLSTQLNGLVKPLLVHGFLNLFRLQKQAQRYIGSSVSDAVRRSKVTRVWRGTHHVHTLHERQTHGLIPGETDHTRRRLRSPLQQSHHGLHAHLTAL